MDSKNRKKILVCIDKFKGTLTQKQAGRALIEVLAPHADIEQVEISDGGEGFLDAIERIVPDAQRVKIEVRHPQGKHMQTTSFIISNKTAYLEVAILAGLQQVEVKGDIFLASSYAVGQAIKVC